MDKEIDSISSFWPKHEFLTLREFPEETIAPLIFITCFTGIGLVFIADNIFPRAWQGGVLGLILITIPFLAYPLLRRHPRLSIWLVVISWLIASVVGIYWLPNIPAAPLILFPVLLTGLFISIRASFVISGILSLLLVYFARLHLGGNAYGIWTTTSILIWGSFFLIWLSMHFNNQMAANSLQAYYRCTKELNEAREHQGELLQAVKDLANANIQVARLNQLLVAARQYAEQAERAKAEFVANVSHELRTPLNMIIGFSEMIMEMPAAYGPRLPSSLLADVSAIHRNGQHLIGLINDVLNLSQIEANRMVLIKERVSLAEIVDEARLAVQPLLESRNLFLDVYIADGLPLIFCDRTRIRQILLNLLSNASRFTKKGGIKIEITYDDQRVIVSVIDTGPGIAEHDLPKLFEPFHQVDGSIRNEQGGSGLGLNISRRFVELHGGQIGVRSQQGLGSCFWFSLPIEHEKSTQSSFIRWLNNEWEPRQRSKLTLNLRCIPRIVLLEEQNLLFDAIQRYRDDFEVDIASSPSDACELLQQEPANIILVRGESPEQTAEWVPQLMNTPYSTPVIACNLSTQTQGRCQGIIDYLTKPISPKLLLETIKGIDKPVQSILIVDDDIETLQLYSRMLSANQYRVLQAANGHEALSLLKMRLPDLLLLDLIMPGIDGFSVLADKNIDPIIKDIPTIVLSATDPSGQPIFTNSIVVSRGDGFSIPELIRSALTLGECLMVPRRAPDPVPLEKKPG